MNKKNTAVLKLSICAVLAAPASALACSSCGCTLSSDWESQGISSQEGFRLDLRYDYINQNQLRNGSGTASSAALAGALAAGSVGETEQKTTNHYTTLGLDYSPNRAWGVNVQIPYIDRAHDTLAAGDTDTSSSHTRSLGDVKLIGRYQGLSPDGDIGLLFGVKLPTGDYRNNFSAGPASLNPAPGNQLDRSLQPGSGSTDLIVGAYRFGSLNKDWDWFAQGIYQYAVKTADEYRPGNSLNMNAGFRYMDFGNFVPQIQINAKTGRPDGGLNADTSNSGGEIAYLSPGATVVVSKSTKVYGFVQLPLYQRVEGFQLAPRWNASIGVNISL
ncbi:MAG: hypothetical protein K8F27_07570 [Sulfuricellaceae bacterium]|nr:hypothetical protein [Sulfuricellaceae bacterium]